MCVIIFDQDMPCLILLRKRYNARSANALTFAWPDWWMARQRQLVIGDATYWSCRLPNDSILKIHIYYVYIIPPSRRTVHVSMRHGGYLLKEWRAMCLLACAYRSTWEKGRLKN